MTYTPESGFIGIDSFEYTISDQNGKTIDTATVSVQVTRERQADFSIRKSDSPDPVAAGQPLSYTVTVTNDPLADAQGVVVTDTLPAGVSNPVTSGCLQDPNGVPTCSLGAMAAGTSKQYTITVDVDPGAPATLINTASVSSSTSLTNTGDDTITAVTTVIREADLLITKTDGLTTVVAGQAAPLTYTITASNPTGPSDANGSVITDTIPIELVSLNLVSCTPIGVGAACDPSLVPGPLASNNFSATVDLPVGTTVVYQISGQVDPAALAGLLSNTANVAPGAGVTDPNNTNNSATDNDTNVTREADLAITKTDGLTTVVAGQPMFYTITASNPAGPSDANGSVITDTIPIELVSLNLVSCTPIGVGSACDPSLTPGSLPSNNFSATVDLPVGTSVEYQISGQVDPGALPGFLSNTATVATAAGVTETNLANNSATDNDTNVTQEADLQMEKTPVTTNVTAGGSVTYTLKVTNNGPSNSTGSTVIDTFPADLTHSSNTCGSTPAGSMFTWTVGALGPGAMASCTVTFDVSSAATANIVNSATVTAIETDPNAANDTAQTKQPHRVST